MRRLGNALVVSVFMFAMSVSLFAANRELQQSGMELQRVDENLELNRYVGPNGMYHHIGEMTVQNKNGQDVTVVNDTIFYYVEADAQGNLDDFMASYQEQNTTNVGDTVVTLMTLLAPGDITEIHTMFHSGGTANYGVWGPAWVESQDDPGSYLYNFPAPNDADLIGLPFVVPINVSATTSDNPSFEVWDVSSSGFTVHVDSTYYLSLTSTTGLHVWVGYITDGRDGTPGIWQGNTFQQHLSRSFSNLHVIQSGAWYRIVSTADNSYVKDHMMRIVVEHQFLPPLISGVTALSNTFNLDSEVSAEIVKMGTGTIDSAYVLYSKYDESGNETTGAVEMTNTGGDSYSATITAARGDSIRYQVWAKDSEGLENYSGVEEYRVRHLPSSDQKILLVAEGDAYNHDSLYVASFGRMQSDLWELYSWNVAENNGIDASVLDTAYFDAAIVFGWGIASVPLTNETDYAGYGDFLDDGGDILLIDMDYFFAHTGETDLTFQSGDFGFDYFGIGGGTNDPNDGTVGIADVELAGVAGNSLTGTWETDNYGPIVYDPEGWANWGDYASANGSAETVFTGSQSGEGMGIAYQNGNTFTLFLPFAAELAGSADFDSLLMNFMDWSGNTRSSSAIEDENGVPLSFNLEQNYPNPFNPSTRISYSLPSKDQVSLTVYDLNGKVVKTLVNDVQNADAYEVTWDGTNNAGVRVASGVYMYRLVTSSRVDTKKMLLIR